MCGSFRMASWRGGTWSTHLTERKQRRHSRKRNSVGRSPEAGRDLSESLGWGRGGLLLAERRTQGGQRLEYRGLREMENVEGV